ncbi:50S ribosomal protein L11 methyltransferase [Foetidibacter luteolus]|uniref:50S ribosomal protein L11 methyltransferase n=1 Tax=Foetidibacter luteolus TaxID=2608880 RepID=UPI00129BBD3D|nr:50S ribosomal protein L11 methyltransferase [Foetidibacter luteolus]
MSHVQITITPVTEEQKEILVALLSHAGFEGFEEQDNLVKAFIPADNFDEETLSSITGRQGVSYQKSIVPMQNWNAVWESSFEPVCVDDFVAVRADFHAPVSNVQHEIVITPKMSFGTGHHATTYMMMDQMRHIDFSGKKVFDFGTGTGILAILAEKLGASSVLAIDNDEWCINNSRENVHSNQCENIRVELAGNVATGEKFDVILANINKNVILDNLNALCGNLQSKGFLLLSGLLAEDEADILYAIEKFNVLYKGCFSRDKWICMLFNG